MAIAFISSDTPRFQKSLQTSELGVYGGTGILPAGSLIVVGVTLGNTSATTPTVSSISKREPTDPATFVKLAEWNTVASAGGGQRGELWAIVTTIPWGSGTDRFVTVNFSAAAECSLVWAAAFSGATTTLRGTAGVSNSGSASCSPQAGDLVIGFAAGEDNSAPTADSDTVDGSWSIGYSGFTTGGGAASNVAGIGQYKIVSGSSTQTYNSTIGGDGGVIAVALQPAPPPTGSATGAHAWSGSAVSGGTALGSASGSTSWSATAAGTSPLITPTFEHWFCGASSATHGYNELHFKAESFDRVIEVQERTWSEGTESFATFHTSATIPAGQEYVARHEGLVLAGDAYAYRARQTVASQTSNWANASPYGPAEPNAVMGSGWLSWLEVYDQGITYDAISGIVTVGGYERYYHGNGKKADETTNNWFEYRSLHEELDAFYQAETVYLTGTTSLQRPRFCQANLNNKIYVFGPFVSGAYSTAVYSFGGSSWTTGGSPAMPTAQAWVTAVIGTKVYAAGANNTLYVWDTAGASSWSSLTYSGSSAPHWMAAVGGKLYLYCQDGSFKSYDPSTSTWTTGLTAPTSPYLTSNLASNPVGMDSHGRIYLWGGRTATESEHNYSANLWHYDVADDAWGSDQALTGAGSHATMTYSAHWNALLIGTYRVTTVDGAAIGHSSPRMLRPIEPGAISDGAATGSTSWTSTATGTTQRSGFATGSHTWTGTATSEGLKQGSGTGASTWTGTASGSRQPTATAAGTCTWAAVAVGVTGRAGSATRSVTWVATTSGVAPRHAAISAGVLVATIPRAHSRPSASRFFRPG